MKNRNLVRGLRGILTLPFHVCALKRGGWWLCRAGSGRWEREKQIAYLPFWGRQNDCVFTLLHFSLTHSVAVLLWQILAGHGTFERAKVSWMVCVSPWLQSQNKSSFMCPLKHSGVDFSFGVSPFDHIVIWKQTIIENIAVKKHRTDICVILFSPFPWYPQMVTHIDNWVWKVF